MCNTAAVGGGGVVQQALLPPAKTDVAGAAGGGGGDLAQALGALSTALQQLVSAVQALFGGTSGGGAKDGVAQLGASLPVQQSGHSAHQHDLGPVSQTSNASAPVKQLLGENVVSTNGAANVSPSGKRTFVRTQPENRQKALAIVQRLMQSTAKYQDPAAAQAAGYDFNKHKLEGDLLHVSKKGGQDLNLDDPGMLLYRKLPDGRLKLIGAVLGSNRSAPDLGMGQWHVHGATNINMMKHIWFTPNDLDTAYQEATPPASKI